MDRENTRKSAVKLRMKGKTYPEICRTLKVSIPKSTLSYWCRGVELPDWYKKKLKKINLRNNEKARTAAVVANRERRKKFLNSLRRRNVHLFEELDKKTLKMLLAMLYTCEGAKWKSHRGLALGNSDPEFVKAYVTLLKICYPEIIQDNFIRCRISYRVDQDLSKLQRFWSRKLNIPLSQFYKSIPDPRTKGKPTKKNDYKGICVVTSRGTEIQLELEIIADMFFEKINNGPLA